ncbi:MAG TPA: tetratricopeptide repeat protein [Candidatus Obscuribacterales bacterium]
MAVVLVAVVAHVAIVSGEARPARRASSFNQVMEQAKLLRKAGQKTEALKLYRKAVTMRPASSEAHAELGWVLFELKEVDEAMREEIKAIELDRRNANAYHHLGAMYLAMNMWNEAADQFRMSLTLDPKKRCNCGPIEALIMSHPPRGDVLTPEEADRILANPPGTRAPSPGTPARSSTDPRPVKEDKEGPGAPLAVN